MNLLKILSDSFQDNWDLPAVTDIETGLTLEYASLAARMGRIQLLLQELGAEKNTRIAVIGENSIDFVANYMGALTMGSTVVTFPASSMSHDLIDMLSQVKTEIIFVDNSWDLSDIDLSHFYSLRHIISMDTARAIYASGMTLSKTQGILDTLDLTFSSHYPLGFQKRDALSPEVDPDATAAIFFTSGTTGPAKAVLLSHDNLEGNVIYGIKAQFHPRHSVAYTALSLSMVWGCVFDMIITLASGGLLSITPRATRVEKLIEYLHKARPDKILVSPRQCLALLRHAGDVQNDVLTEEKGLFGALKRWRIRRNFNKSLGGRCRELIVAGGGVEKSLPMRMKSLGIKFSVAYGMAECGGLVSYISGDRYRPGTVGCTIQSMVKTRLSPLKWDGWLPEGAGQLELKGMIVSGNYENDEDYPSPLTADGWLRTGDIATIDENGLISILGRIDTVIERQGHIPFAPEYLELKLENQPSIMRALVVQRNDKLAALVWAGDTSEETLAQVQSDIDEVNDMLGADPHIDEVELLPEPPIQTSKNTLMRWLYS